ncbi:hypothetical protein OH77DRAFT_1422925 [Trametes cingulata]|nr:hypothetical protein OH77DRAFT_1422925 [Trametes cingulata]
MSSSDETQATAVIQLYQAVFASGYIVVAATALLLYDVLLSFDAEARLVWRNPKSFASLLYLLNRYLALFILLLSFATINPIPDNSCIAVGWCLSILAILELLGPAVFAALRMYALSGRNKYLSAVTLILSLAPALEALSDTYKYLPANEAPPANCTVTGFYSPQINIGRALAARLPVILADCLVISITWRESFKNLNVLHALRNSEQPSLYRIFLQNGSVYFCALLSLNILDITLGLLQITLPDSVNGGGSYVTQIISPMNFILTSRFLLDLRSVQEKLSAGSGSSGSASVGTLQFAGADIQSGQFQPFMSLSEDPQADHDDCVDDGPENESVVPETAAAVEGGAGEV